MFLKNLRKFAADDYGVAAIIFAFSIPMIFGSAGVGVDLAKAYHTKNKLSKTLDSASLAAASTNLTGSELKAFVKNYVKNNFNESDHSTIDLDNIDVRHNEETKTITIYAEAISKNTFMQMLPFDNPSVKVDAISVSKKKLTGVEVALVLDNSKSMTKDNRINSLRDASRDFVDTLYTSAADSGGEFKIGIVPYGLHVNVGPYGLGKASNNSSTYADGRAFVNNPENLKYTNSRNEKEDKKNYGWSGCVFEHDLYNSFDHKANWDMFKYCHKPDGTRSTEGGGNCKTDYTKQVEWKQTGYWEERPTYTKYDCYKKIDGVEIFKEDGCTKKEGGKWKKYSEPKGENKYETRYNNVNIHAGCPKSIIQPLVHMDESGGKGTLKSSIASLNADGESTQSDIGMAWGYELLSPGFPFEEGADWDSQKWQKAIVFMTDGEIRSHARGPYYGLENNDKNRTNRSEEIFEAMCNRAKSKGILIYTVQFGDDGNEALLNACATDSGKALKASNGSALRDTFKTIAEDLGNIFLAE